MNRLASESRERVVSCLVRGMSIGSTARVTGTAKNTIVKLLVDLGVGCSQYLDNTLRNLSCRVIECDEIWSFGYPKTKNIPIESQLPFGDVWTWTAIDTETRLAPSWLVGWRDGRDCYAFLSDLRSRIVQRSIELTSNGLVSYLSAIEPLFSFDQLDHAKLIKAFEGGDERLHDSSPEYSGIEHRFVAGYSDPERFAIPSAPHKDLTMRIGMRRVARPSDAFSKKVENHAAAVSLHFMFYNFALPHPTLFKAAGPRERITPAMAAGVADHVWLIREIAALLD